MMLRRLFLLLLSFSLSGAPLRAAEPAPELAKNPMDLPAKILEPAKRAIEKIGTPDSKVREPDPDPMPTQAPPMPKPPDQEAEAGATKTDRFFAHVADWMTTTWNDNIFVWLPAISTDPNRGPTIGLLPVLVLADPQKQIRHLLAPSYTFNDVFGQTGTMRYYFYPRERSQLFLLGSYSQRTNRELKARFEDAQLVGGRLFLRAEGRTARDGASRFFGIGPDTADTAEASYTAKESSFRLGAGLNFFGVWRLSAGMRYLDMETGPTAVRDVVNLTERFPGLPGTDRTKTITQEARLLCDSRDIPVTPSRGASGELFFEKTTQAWGSDSDFIKYGLEGKRYMPWPRPGHITVLRGLFEKANGPFIPFYELPSVGGRDTLRGFGDGRFTDHGRMVFNIEHRVTIASLALMGVQTNFEVAPFVDLGSVFPTLDAMKRRNFRAVYGLGFRAAVKPNVVGDVEVGVGQEGMAVFVDINYPF